MKIITDNISGWIFVILTCVAVYYGQTSIFYVIYFFWWTEFIRILVDSVSMLFNPSGSRKFSFALVFYPLVQMGIYLVFVVVLFGVMGNWGQKEILLLNLNILFFRNWFFNTGLIFVIAQQVYLKIKEGQTTGPSFNIFTRNMIILHVSIILGGILMMFVVRRFPDLFSPENHLGSLLVIAPFLLLKIFEPSIFKRPPAVSRNT